MIPAAAKRLLRTALANHPLYADAQLQSTAAAAAHVLANLHI
jgi:hypothetical protein